MSASKLGFPQRLVERAKTFLSPEERRVQELVQELERVRRIAERDGAVAARLKEEALALKATYEKKMQELAARKEKMMAEAQEQALSVVRAARREAEEIIREFKEKLRAEERREQEKAVQAVRERLQRLAAQCTVVPETQEELAPGVLNVGATVYVPRFGQEGTVVDLSKESVTVQVGSFRVALPPGAVRPVAHQRATGAVRMAGAACTVSPTVDLRGQRVEEALTNLERYLDAALLAGLGRVDIIHGYGTGALRAAVREFLLQHPRVRSFRLGGPGEGGPGVTIAELA
uniref:Smr domain-containing protein n=1 Tax=Ammonifex degensii TaxID=42838 RepID=A0A7C1FFR6_9THEO